MRGIRLAAIFLAIAAVGAAKAQFLVSVLTSTVAFTPSGVFPIPFLVTGPQNNFVTFMPGQVPTTVGNGTGRSSATVNIIYHVDGTAAYPVDSMGVVIHGLVIDTGRIFFAETVEDDFGGVVLSATESFLGGSYSGGTNGIINFSHTYAFSRPLRKFLVKKTFFLDIGNAQMPTSSIASLGLVEQNLLPEPATFVVFGLGIVPLLLRRRRR